MISNWKKNTFVHYGLYKHILALSVVHKDDIYDTLHPVSDMTWMWRGDYIMFELFNLNDDTWYKHLINALVVHMLMLF